MEYPSVEIKGVTVAQFPNPPLALALAAAITGRLTDGAARDASTAVFYLGLCVWAYLEVSEGVNWFRRALGVVGLVYAVVGLSRELGS